MSNAKQEVTPAQVTSATPVKRWVDAMVYEADNTNTEDIAARQAELALEADSLEAAMAVMDGPEIPSGKDMISKPHVIRGFTVHRSDKEQYAQGLPVFFTVEAVNPNGEEFIYNTGAPNILVVLWKARETGRLPLKVIITGKPTKNGTLLSLKLLD